MTALLKILSQLGEATQRGYGLSDLRAMGVVSYGTSSDEASGVCLVSRSDAEEATKKNIFGWVDVEFEVKTAQGQSAMWKRYLVQLVAPLLSRTNAQGHKVGTWRPTRHLSW